ncbi:MAG: alkaline phosphatase, partial [Rhodobacteraceae bacterium]|nr:alkaline phosphatase [Paracoccaceae bacterium]
MALIPGLALGQAIYPLDRATILSGSKFDFKVEFPTVVQPDQVEVLINGESYDTLLGAKAEFIENEDESGGSSLVLRDVTITEPGSYTVEAKAGDTSRSVGW